MSRVVEFIFSIIIIIIIFPVGLIISFIIFIDIKENPFHFSKRVGQNNRLFYMPKFKTMKKDTPQIATDLINEKDYITRSGKYLRRFSIDELPQFFSVIKGVRPI